jgi:DNA-directed RNA polymerase specialized sigma24 family protein
MTREGVPDPSSLNDQSVAATAEALGVSAEMVRTRSARALARLRERLGTDVELLS